MKGLYADKCFLGINGFTMDEGLTTPNPYEAEMKRTMIQRSRECYLLADSRKLGVISMCNVGALTDLYGIVSDNGLPPYVEGQLRDLGITVL